MRGLLYSAQEIIKERCKNAKTMWDLQYSYKIFRNEQKCNVGHITGNLRETQKQRRSGLNTAVPKGAIVGELYFKVVILGSSVGKRGKALVFAIQSK